MKQDIKLKKGADKRIRSGHLWIFSNEITDKLKKYKGGDIADLYSYKGEFLGRGYINPLSLIAIRILTYKKEDIDTNFFYNRINRALSYRKEMYPDANSYRVVFGESDFLPGLIVDKYEDYLIVQILSLGMEIRKDTILNALEDVFHPAGIIERNDVAVRELEGLKIHKGILKGDLKDNIIIRENGVKFEVDILNGQKTGFFFDQRENRQVIKKYVKKVDVFDELGRLFSVGEKFVAIILDPPAFVKSAGKVKEALKGYKEINLQAMKLLKNGGILITCSCSYHIDKETFRDMLIHASSDSERDFRIIEFRGQAPDHPVLLSMRETEYLKCAVLKMG